MSNPIWSALVFYARCAKWAARGTIERANAWFWAIGVPIVAFIGGFWGGELHIPDNPQGFVTFMIVTVIVTWIVFFTVRFFGAPAALYSEKLAEITALRKLLPDNAATQPSLCDFGRWNRRLVSVDTGETYAGKQQYNQLWIPIRFKRNAKSVTIRINVLRPVGRLDSEAPQSSLKVVESKDYLQGDQVDLVFATIAVDRQHHGFYGSEFRPDLSYIADGSRHLFEVDVFFDGGHETIRIYLEGLPQQTYAGPPVGVGHIVGIAVVQGIDSVFDSDWIRESRAAVEGKRKPYAPEPPTRGFGFGWRR